MAREDAAVSRRSFPVGTPRLVLAGTGFWVLVGTGAVTGNSTLIGLAVVLAAGTAVVVITRAARTASARLAQMNRVWADGLPARAQVVSLEAGSARLNGNPQVELVLDVTVDGREPYRVTVSMFVSTLAIPRVQPGCEIDVRVDPADAAYVVVDPALRL
jgi:hypothetical protein